MMMMIHLWYVHKVLDTNATPVSTEQQALSIPTAWRSQIK